MAELAAERQLVKEALDELKVDAWVFEEDAGARPESIEETFLEEVDAADLYLGVFWKGYGPYTREEYDHATKLKKDRLVYEKRTNLEEREAELEEFLDELDKVDTGVTPKWFESPNELREFVKEDVAAWQTRTIRKRRGRLVQALRYGFILALVVIVLGFGLAYYQASQERSVDDLEGLVHRAIQQALDRELQGLGDQVRDDVQEAIIEAVAASQDPSGTLRELAQGRTDAAKRAFQQASAEYRAAGKLKLAAEAERHLGALTFLDDTRASLTAYRSATRLDPDNPEGWYQLGHLLRRTGDATGAEDAYRKVLAHGESVDNPAWEAMALRNLGVVYMSQGDLDQALELFEKALSLNQELDDKEELARTYGNIGVVYLTLGDLDQALEMHRKALALDRELLSKKGVARDYGNLGVVYLTRQDLDRAFGLFEKALALNQQLDNKEGMARDYGNLGIIYKRRGNLNQAIEMHKKSLEIETKLDNKQGIAADYTGLGIVYFTRWEQKLDLESAEEMFEESLALHKEQKHREGMAADYGNLGLVYLNRGELLRAEEMYKKTLALCEDLPKPDFKAFALEGLGHVYKLQGAQEKAVWAWSTAQILYANLDRPDKADEMGGLLEGLGEEQ